MREHEHTPQAPAIDPHIAKGRDTVLALYKDGVSNAEKTVIRLGKLLAQAHANGDTISEMSIEETMRKFVEDSGMDPDVTTELLIAVMRHDAEPYQ